MTVFHANLQSVIRYPYLSVSVKIHGYPQISIRGPISAHLCLDYLSLVWRKIFTHFQLGVETNLAKIQNHSTVQGYNSEENPFKIILFLCFRRILVRSATFDSHPAACGRSLIPLGNWREGLLCLMNNVADGVLADKADLSEVFSWLYKLINRSTSAHASSRSCRWIWSRRVGSFHSMPFLESVHRLLCMTVQIQSVTCLVSVLCDTHAADYQSYLPIYAIMAPVPWTRCPEFIVWKMRLVNSTWTTSKHLLSLTFSLCTFDRRCFNQSSISF